MHNLNMKFLLQMLHCVCFEVFKNKSNVSSNVFRLELSWSHLKGLFEYFLTSSLLTNDTLVLYEFSMDTVNVLGSWIIT